jgi:hypothetical protein
MKTLVIHPKDSSTDFLSAIYADQNWDVINTNCSKSHLCRQIKDHDRIILMGHGTDQGLIGYGHYVIDSKLVYLLRDPQKSYIFIWCNSDLFVQKYKLKAFHTGMIISEYEEALYFCVPTCGADLDQSNKLLATAFRHSIDSPKMLEDMVVLYFGHTPVIQFNLQHFYDNR